MSSSQVDRHAEQIREKLPKYGSVERAAEEVIRDFEEVMGELPDSVSRNIAQASELVRSSLEEVEILRPSSIIKPRNDWYQGPQPHDRHWLADKGAEVPSATPRAMVIDLTPEAEVALNHLRRASGHTASQLVSRLLVEADEPGGNG